MPEDLDEYRQGDVLDLMQVPVVTANGIIRQQPTPNGVVVVTQTCDLVLRSRPTFHVACVVVLEEDKAKPARSGRQPNLVHIPELGPQSFADLSFIATLDKSVLSEVGARHGILQIDDVRRFGQRVGRRFARFAFPDEVVPWVRPLQKLVEGREGNLESPVGWALDHVVSLRLECEEGWKSTPYALALCVVLKAGVIPSFEPDELPDLPVELSDWLYDANGEIRRKPADIAQRLKRENAEMDSIVRYWLWGGFADSLAAMCVPSASAATDILAAVEGGQIRGDLSTSEEFSFERYRRSEELDLDHLSPPLPLQDG
ncbi:hypothetical protein [Streptomyces sp. GESEQ-35]|uniref:hypothetical protein n=1 Tax=Streptomyces sp. GESEQ-35 TaxID=2812657 RepID=UPI001B32A09F|nr:hypothetical protein [Streptomyces sp. GESEQ-35]